MMMYIQKSVYSRCYIPVETTFTSRISICLPCFANIFIVRHRNSVPIKSNERTDRERKTVKEENETVTTVLRGGCVSTCLKMLLRIYIREF